MCMSFYEVLKKIVRTYGHKEFIFFYQDKKRISYLQTYSLIKKICKSFIALNINENDKVILCADNSLELVGFFFACTFLGIEVILLPSHIGISSINKIILECKPELSIFVNRKYENLSSGLNIININSSTFKFEDFLQIGKNVDEKIYREKIKSTDKETSIFSIFTSGTTGNVKKISVKNSNFLLNSHLRSTRLELNCNDVSLTSLPLFHVMGLLTLVGIMQNGGNLVLLKKFNINDISNAICNEKVTTLVCVPTMIVALIDRKISSAFFLKSIVVAGAVLNSLTLKKASQKFNLKNIYTEYGASETLAISIGKTNANCKHRERVPHCGQSLDGVDVKVVSLNDNKSTIRNNVGEICIKTKFIYSDFDETRNWFYTGDLGMMDDYGNITVMGRIKDTIIKGGETFAPVEIEDIIQSFSPVIKLAKVVGVPDNYYGEKIVAFVQVHDKNSLLKSKLEEFLEKNLSYRQIPDEIILLKDFPCTQNGKISKFNLKKLYTKLSSRRS